MEILLLCQIMPNEMGLIKKTSCLLSLLSIIYSKHCLLGGHQLSVARCRGGSCIKTSDEHRFKERPIQTDLIFLVCG